MSETDLVITIQPDNIPELDEELMILLTGVQPVGQRLKSGAINRKVIIAENDNPGGIFQFADTTQANYTLTVSLSKHNSGKLHPDTTLWAISWEKGP